MSPRLAPFVCTTLALLLAPWRPAVAAPCEMGTLAQACASPAPDRSALCKLLRHGADDDGFAFVHLGASFYLVEGPNLALVNTETGGKADLSVRVDPVLAGAKPMAGERCLIADYRSLLAHGQVSDRGTLLMVRQNPVSGTPYLLDVGLAAVPLGEARGLMCGDVKNQKRVRLCSNPRSFDKAWQGAAHPYTSAEDMLRANKAAQTADDKAKSPHLLYEKAGMLAVLDEKPKDLSLGQYVLLLNNYAFVATKTDRVELAVELLDKVLRLAPERVPAYLNLADALDALVAARDGATPLSEASLAKLRSASAAFRKQYSERKQAPSPSAATAARSPEVEALAAQFRQKAAPRLAQLKRQVDQTQKQLDARSGDADALVAAFAKEHDKHLQALAQLLEGERNAWPKLDGDGLHTLAAALDKTVEPYGAHVVEGPGGPALRGAVHGLVARRFGRWLTPAMKELAARVAQEERADEQASAIAWDELAERVLFWEQFLTAHPGFVGSDVAKDRHERYRTAYFVGPADRPPFDATGVLRPELKKSYQGVLAKHKSTQLGTWLGDYLAALKQDQWRRGPAVERFLRERKLLASQD